jgi:hypothetical protein
MAFAGPCKGMGWEGLEEGEEDSPVGGGCSRSVYLLVTKRSEMTWVLRTEAVAH